MVERLESHQPGKIRIWTGLDRSWLYEIYYLFIYFLAENKGAAADEHGVKSIRPPRSHAQSERVAPKEGGWFTACLGGAKERTSDVPPRARLPFATKTRGRWGKFPQLAKYASADSLFSEIQRIVHPFFDDVFTEEGGITLFAVALWPGLHSGAAPVFLNRVTGVNWVEWVCSLPSLSNRRGLWS